MPEIEPKEKRAKSSLSEFQTFLGEPCCRQTKYNSTGLKTRSKCEGQASPGKGRRTHTMTTKTLPEVPAGMQRVCRRFERWRSSHRGRLPIPAALWTAAVEVAREHGVFRTAKTLRLEHAKSPSGGILEHFAPAPSNEHDELSPVYGVA
jgi:hypothetical protein